MPEKATRRGGGGGGVAVAEVEVVSVLLLVGAELVVCDGLQQRERERDE